MKSIQRNTLIFAMTSLLAMPAPLLAADTTKDEHSGHDSGQAVTASSSAQFAPAATQEKRQAMRARMLEIRASKDPEQRKQLMEAQMNDMEAMLQDGACPMMASGKGGMMGAGKDMKCGKGGMMCKGTAGADDMMAKRMDMMEKRIDMMQMMMQMQMRMGMGTPGK